MSDLDQPANEKLTADTPFGADGTAPEAPRPVCKCGAGPHRSNPEICAKGHAIKGNQRARVHQDERAEALEDMPAQSISTFDVLDRQVARLQQSIEHRERRLKLPLSASKRERLERTQAQYEAALLGALERRDKLQKEGHRATANRTNNVLARLSDATFALNSERPSPLSRKTSAPATQSCTC
jgi:hypothetical protein